MNSMMITPALVTMITLAFALAHGLVKILETVLNKLLGKDVNHLSEEERHWSRTTHDILTKTDEEGVPLVYVPRSMFDTQKEVVKALAAITQHQEKMTYILERMAIKMGG
jgi:hypothetical protein